MKIFSDSLSPKQRGFTLVEILVVIGLMVVLMSLTVGLGRWALDKSKIEKCRVQVRVFDNALERYAADNSEFPPGDGTDRSSEQLYDALYNDGILNDSKVYMPELDPDDSDMFKRQIDNGLINDPFKKNKKSYFYLRGVDEDGEQQDEAYNPDFDIWSLGPNGVGRNDGGVSDEAIDDDIGNWNR